MLTFEEIGKEFKYPQCCIEDFVSGKSSNGKSWGGFIPCPEHQKLTLEEITFLLGRNPTIDDVVIEVNCESCDKITYFDKVKKNLDSLYVCPDCFGDPNIIYCQKCRNEIPNWKFLAIEGETFCYKCFSEKFDFELKANAKLNTECNKSIIPINDINYISEVQKNSEGITLLKFECDTCGDQHTSEIIYDTTKDVESFR